MQRISNSSPVAAVPPVGCDTFGLRLQAVSLSHFLMVTLCSRCPGGWKGGVLPDDNFTISKKQHQEEISNYRL